MREGKGISLASCPVGGRGEGGEFLETEAAAPDLGAQLMDGCGDAAGWRRRHPLGARQPPPNGDPPQRHVPPFPLFQLVITWRRPPAPRTTPRHPGVPSHGNFNTLRLARPTPEPNVLKDEAGMGLNLAQNRFNLQLNGWSPDPRFLCCSNHRLTLPMEPAFSQPRCCGARRCLFSSSRSLSFSCVSYGIPRGSAWNFHLLMATPAPNTQE